MYNVEVICNKMLYNVIICRIMSLNVKMYNIVFEYDDKCKIVSNNVILCNVIWCGVE